MLSLQERVRDGAPLLRRRVYARRVVRARVQEEHRPFRRFAQRSEESGIIKSDGFGVIVRVVFGFNADVLEDCFVVGWNKWDGVD